MSQTLEIPDTLYTALKEAAEARGLTPVAWIAAHLQHAESETESQATQASSSRTLADLFAGRVGRIHCGCTERGIQPAADIASSTTHSATSQTVSLSAPTPEVGPFPCRLCESHRREHEHRS